MVNILIVEDQTEPLVALQSAVHIVLPTLYPSYYKGRYDLARCYNDARQKISENDYDMVLLDNRMPRENQGNLEETDFDTFCSRLENIGYTLIPDIKRKNPNTVIIGTSSLSKGELRSLPAPDCTMSKMWGEAERDLEARLSSLNLKR